VLAHRHTCFRAFFALLYAGMCGHHAVLPNFGLIHDAILQRQHISDQTRPLQLADKKLGVDCVYTRRRKTNALFRPKEYKDRIKFATKTLKRACNKNLFKFFFSRYLVNIIKLHPPIMLFLPVYSILCAVPVVPEKYTLL
jgi:hypothetical protein